MSAHRHARIADVLGELQSSLTQGPLERRVGLLKRVTDLFLHSDYDYTEEHVAVFDDVFGCLVAHIHHEATVTLAQRLAPVRNAPRKIMRHLALHDLIDVAAPVLAQSDRLDEATLIEVASSRSERHLLAITARPALSGGVTDVLLERGSNDVVRAVAGNPNAALTELGYDKLVARADRSDWIATCLQMRPAMPRHHYLRLLDKASASVRQSLEASFPEAADAIATTIAELTETARSAPATFSEATAISHKLVRLLHEDGRLDDRQVGLFAEEGQFDEVSAALGCLARIPVTLAEAMMVQAQDEGLFILGKVCGLSWLTVRSIIALRIKLGRHAKGDPDDGREIYAQLRSATAHQVLRFHRMQLSAARV